MELGVEQLGEVKAAKMVLQAQRVAVCPMTSTRSLDHRQDRDPTIAATHSELDRLFATWAVPDIRARVPLARILDRRLALTDCYRRRLRPVP